MPQARRRRDVPESHSSTSTTLPLHAALPSHHHSSDEAAVPPLPRGRNASNSLPRRQQHANPPPPPPRSPRRGSSYSSSFSEPDQRMSLNPAHEATEGLFRALDGMSSARSTSASASSHSSSSSSSPSSSVHSEPQHHHHHHHHHHHPVRKMEGTLPANDGMHSLRQRLHEIRKLAISTEEKAMKMHLLMTADYQAHKAVDMSPLSLTGSDSRFSSEEPAALDVGVAAMPINATNPYNIRPGDLDRTFSPLAIKSPQDVPQDVDLDESMEDDDPPALGCMHYLRNVKIQCFDCHRWFPCRHCHDSSHDLPFPHTLRRKMIRNMLCMLCLTPQPAGEACVNCHEWAAYYYCAECKLWDNDSNKSIYHCDDCGICRLGEGLGKDFVHCKKCNVCISISTSAAHPCVEGATEGDCPLCLEGMFASRAKVVSLPCGHYMHAVCYKDLMAVTYKCPVCSKSAVNMELQWRKLDDEIQLQPMPDEDEELNGVLPHVEGHVDENDTNASRRASTQRRPRTVWIGCNDCGSRSWTPFHWLGLKCRVCDSYNTNQMPPTAGHETEAERLIRQQQVHRQHDFTGNAVLRDAGIGAEEARRVDSALDVPPSSPRLLSVPGSPSSPTSSASSPRRYFVQDEEPRRPSFTVPRFSTPTLPTLPHLPEMPRLPRMPNMPSLHNMPQLPHIPGIGMPELALPTLEFGLPRFSPYDVFDSLSRSLSPMRAYLPRGEMQEEQKRRKDANRSPLSVRSDPTGDATSLKRRKKEWDSDGEIFSSEESDGGVLGDGDSGGESGSEEDEEEEEESDVEMGEEEWEEGEDEGDHWNLPGHR